MLLSARVRPISKSAKMIEIGRGLPFPFQMTCIDSKVRDAIPIPGILADLEINLDENSGAMQQHKLYYMCFRSRSFLDLLPIKDLDPYLHFKILPKKGSISSSLDRSV